MPVNVPLSVIPEWIQGYRQLIDSYIAREFADAQTELDKLAFQELEGGSRIRAVLTLLWCEALGGNKAEAVPIAVAYELAHSAALIQDDIIDESETRQGGRSFVAKYGVARSILASNALLFFVPRMIGDTARITANVETTAKLLVVLGECCHRATLGEFLDLELAGKESVTEEEYLHMVGEKTGALVAASCVSGAILGIGFTGKEDLGTAYGFGESIGIAYQIQDDVMDLLGSEEFLGKPPLTDLKSRKMSLVLIHLLDFCTPEEKRFIFSLRGRASVETHDLEILRTLVARYGSSQYATEVATIYAEKAKSFLDKLDETPARHRMMELSDFLIRRLS
jgi:geranylgeranyl pyrophosphate synthase